jgi:transposase
VQSKAFKKRQAQQYFTIEVGHHADRPTAPLELRSSVDHAQRQRAAALDGVSLLVAGGKAATLADAEMVAAWQGQDKVEHCVRLVNQLFLVTPLFLKTPQRMAALVLLIMVGALVAGLIERQVRRALAASQQPITGLRPARRDTWHLTIARLCQAFADSSLVHVKDAGGRAVETRFARLNPVQAHILKVIGLPQPVELFAQPALA